MAENNQESNRDLILKHLKGKSVLKQNIHDNASLIFKDFKAIIKSISDDLKREINKSNGQITIECRDKNNFETELKVADDTLIFVMHTDIFTFDKSNQIWKSSYLETDNDRSFCAMILIYNFLSDSFKYNRNQDLGILLARIFINKENHFFVEGKRQLGVLFNNFDRDIIDKNSIKAIIEAVILHSLELDLLVPPIDAMNQITVQEIIETNLKTAISNARRLGFKFTAEGENIV